jgi:predicted HicB family RNase H-like nuclease
MMRALESRPWAFDSPIPKAVRKETSAVLTQTTEKYQEVLQFAESRYRQSPDWVTFFREVLGVDGIARKTFPTYDELSAFEQSEEHEKIQKLLVKLREKRPSADTESEPTRVITVRLPKSMHESLRTEAHDLRTSMNKLCISKLLQVIDEEMIPNERASGSSTSSSSAPTSSSSGNHSASYTPSPAIRAHQPTTAGVSSPYGQQLQPANPSSSGLPPFKPSQPRF